MNMDYTGGTLTAGHTFGALRAFLQRAESVVNSAWLGSMLGDFFKRHPHLVSLTFESHVSSEYDDQGGNYRCYGLSLEVLEIDMSLHDSQGVDEGADSDEVEGHIRQAFEEEFEGSENTVYEAFLSEWDWESVTREVRRESIAALLAEDAPSGRQLFAAMFPQDSADLPLLAAQLDDLMTAIGSVYVPKPDDRKYQVDVFCGPPGADDENLLKGWTGWARSAAAAKKAALDACGDRRLDLVSSVLRFEVQRIAIEKSPAATEPSSAYKVRYVIRSKSEDTDAVEGAFWSNEEGWTSLDGASLFNTHERMSHALPQSSGGDSEWMLLDEAEDLVHGQPKRVQAAAEGASA